MREWYCAQTKRHEERRALAHVVNTGLEAWLPELRTTKRRHGRPVSLLEPLFPSYLFVVMDPADPHEWQAVRWARGVRDVVGDGSSPLPVPASAMAALLARFGDRTVEAPSLLTPGVQVRIIEGPMTDLAGLVLSRPTARHRVRVLLRLLHRELPVEVDAFDLERVQ
jgi:transcriptional antiterminator RfaH